MKNFNFSSSFSVVIEFFSFYLIPSPFNFNPLAAERKKSHDENLRNSIMIPLDLFFPSRFDSDCETFRIGRRELEVFKKQVVNESIIVVSFTIALTL